MRSLSHIKWHGWVIFLATLYLTFPRLINTVITVYKFKGNTSPLQPFYYKHLFIVINGISLVVGLYALIGIILYTFQRRMGWCFLYSIAIYLIYYNCTLSFYFYGEGIAFVYTLIACLLSLAILLLLLLFSRKRFHIRWFHLILYACLTFIFILIELNKMDVAFALSRLFN